MLPCNAAFYNSEVELSVETANLDCEIPALLRNSFKARILFASGRKG